MPFDFKETSVDSDDLNTYFPSGITTTLRLSFINTYSSFIANEPKTLAHLGAIYGGSEGNRPPDGIITSDHFTFSQLIGIETQGSSSISWPKNSFGIEFQNNQTLFQTINATGQNLATVNINKGIVDENGDKVDLDQSNPLFDMPSEEDWIFKAPFLDRTYLRNVFSYKLSSLMGAAYSPRTELTELFITDQTSKTNPDKYTYHGIYVATEKIKRDSNRVDINKLKDDEDPLEGGYIISIDNPHGIPGKGWYSNNTITSETYGNNYKMRTEYLNVYPDREDLTDAQMQHIQDFMYNFEKAALNHGNYADYIDVDTFADYFLITELSKNPDGYRHSTYFYKDRAEEGEAPPKLKAGPVWDFNEAYGNTVKCGALQTDGWQFLCGYDYPPEDSLPVAKWWIELARDNAFSQKLAERWAYHRAPGRAFDMSRIRTSLKDEAAKLKQSGAIIRDQQRWKTLGVHIPPGLQDQTLLQVFMPTPILNAYDTKIDHMLDHIQARITYMDENLPNSTNNYTIQGLPDSLTATSPTVATDGAGMTGAGVTLVTVLAIAQLVAGFL
ncbi:hypothetical protein EOPP23_05385 [Endozoicomonas sp. OPT23]|uniref:CotH kinase family protein n=1 Tax=Endozoicomonas sp. OPT23 TaxID=2072845 RepID=UPI00129A923F|nr:CotH kinase family protein [Endozoicomonas sp. OPT23]MRI32416.1 hypothetical protein [Endozoicomonas sp. OPT23]